MSNFTQGFPTLPCCFTLLCLTLPCYVLSICAHMEKESIGVQCQKNSISSTQVWHFIQTVHLFKSINSDFQLLELANRVLDKKNSISSTQVWHFIQTVHLFKSINSDFQLLELANRVLDTSTVLHMHGSASSSTTSTGSSF